MSLALDMTSARLMRKVATAANKAREHVKIRSIYRNPRLIEAQLEYETRSLSTNHNSSSSHRGFIRNIRVSIHDKNHLKALSARGINHLSNM